MSRVEIIGNAVLHLGDCRDVMPTLGLADSIVTDPPYGLGFMGKAWDAPENVAFDPATWRLAYNALKPGGHLLAFSGSRTYHRMVCAIEDAGFEIRDQIMWVYGSGFPKSLDVSKAIDKAAGAERTEVLSSYKATGTARTLTGGNYGGGGNNVEDRDIIEKLAPATDDARQWQGWGTALKPAHEPIVVARKPLSEKTVAANVLLHGTGAINVDGCRVETDELAGKVFNNQNTGWACHSAPTVVMGNPSGRFPANIILDGSDEVVAGFPQTTSGQPLNRIHTDPGRSVASGPGLKGGSEYLHTGFGDSGSAARFFYHAKANKHDRRGFDHPTQKPIALMRYLTRLVTPPGGIVLDPFAGTGTTGEAAMLEGFAPCLIEMDPTYHGYIRQRLTETHSEMGNKPQGSLFGEAA